MKLTVERHALVKTLELVGKKTPTQKRREKQVRLFACAARVFLEANESTGGVEALVLEEGSVVLPFTVFLELVKSYAPKTNITIEADERRVRFGSTTLNAVAYSPSVTPPAKFQIFPVTDTWVSSQVVNAEATKRSERKVQ